MSNARDCLLIAWRSDLFQGLQLFKFCNRKVWSRRIFTCLECLGVWKSCSCGKFVMPYEKEAPELLQLYKRKLNFPE